MTDPFQRIIDRAAAGEHMHPDTLSMATTEKFRHECEVRQILKWRDENGSEWAHGYLAKHPRRASLEPDVRQQWARGNRGLNRDWFEELEAGKS